MIGVQQIDRVVEVVEETLKGNSVRMFNTKKESGKKLGGAALDLPKIRRNPLVEIIAINTGCLNQCTYCKTRYVLYWIVYEMYNRVLPVRGATYVI